MKKSTLALSIAAALGGIGMAGNALAVTNIDGAGNNASLVRNDGGIGHQLVIPYFTAQNNNATLLAITNTNTTRAKVVKVRFRGAANSDDVYDFQVLMSPGDMWSASITKDSSGAAKLTTSDKSCTIPDKIRLGTNEAFLNVRLDGRDVAQTLEGYVEVINMADVAMNFNADGTKTDVDSNASTTAKANASALFDTIKHNTSGVAACSSTVLGNTLGKNGSVADMIEFGLTAPTTGLTGDWIILNQTTTAAWSGTATALEVRNSNGPTTGNLVFWPQIEGNVNSAGTFTADPLITSGVLTAQMYDLPDMSTPYAATNISAAQQADATTTQLAVTSVSNQYVTSDDIAAVTDILFSQPMRRYSAAVNYKASTITDANGNTLQVPLAQNGTVATALYRGANSDALTSTTLNNTVYMVARGDGVLASSGGTVYATNALALAAAVGTGSAFYGPKTSSGGNLAFSPKNNRILCLTTISGPARNTIFDREELTPPPPAGGVNPPTFVISPNESTAAADRTVYVCGEAAVLSINAQDENETSALGAVIARSNFKAIDMNLFQNGWVRFNTPAASGSTGLPVMGQSFIRAANGNVNYGFGYSNKVTR